MRGARVASWPRRVLSNQFARLVLLSGVFLGIGMACAGGGGGSAPPPAPKSSYPFISKKYSNPPPALPALLGSAAEAEAYYRSIGAINGSFSFSVPPCPPGAVACSPGGPFDDAKETLDLWKAANGFKVTRPPTQACS